MSAKPRIGFFGLGLMGSGMARRLLDAGYPLTVFNRNPDKSRPLADAGAQIAASPREAAGRSDVIICMVADDDASRAMWLGEQGALAGAAKGTVLVESSTLTVGWVRELADTAAKAGCELLDAPVTGSKPQAASGELNFLVGGPAATLERARPVFSAMGRSATHLGPSGSGALLKLINNFMCGVQMVSLAEATALIEKSGLDRDKALEVLKNGAPGSPLVKNMPARMTSRDYTPNFLLRLMVKDLHYAIAEARRVGLPLGTATAALNAFSESMNSGFGDKDFSSVVEQFRKG